jgi:hypothetical protein
VADRLLELRGSFPVGGLDVSCHVKGFTIGQSLFQRSPAESDVRMWSLNTDNEKT